MIGYSGERSWSFGWEASVTRSTVPLLKGSLGGIYHVAPRGADPFTVHYAAFEPWLIVGGTLGLGVADGSAPVRVAYGGWIAVPPWRLPVKSYDGGDRAWLLTFVVGIRAFGSTSQFYFTPKLWRYTSWSLNS